MAVQAKFMCQRIEKAKYAGSETAKIILTAVTAYNSDYDSKVFWDYTPAGTIELQTVNKAAEAQFIPGKMYFVDFIPAE